MSESLKTHERIERNLHLNGHSSDPETGKFGFKISNALHEYDLFYQFLIKMYVGRVPSKKTRRFIYLIYRDLSLESARRHSNSVDTHIHLL